MPGCPLSREGGWIGLGSLEGDALHSLIGDGDELVLPDDQRLIHTQQSSRHVVSGLEIEDGGPNAPTRGGRCALGSHAHF